MSLRSFSLLVIGLILLTEGLIAAWRFLPIAPSTEPVFSYSPAQQAFGNTPAISRAVEVYHADRGSELRLTIEEALPLTVLYFEWDRVEAGPFLTVSGHPPEICNTSYGYTLRGILPERIHQAPHGESLHFDVTSFRTPSDQPVVVFKLAWMQGQGGLQIRGAYERWRRLRETFQRGAGAGRVLEAGVFGTDDVDLAWDIFRREVLSQLVWM